MEFVIRVMDGEPVGYPMSLENLRYIYDDISMDSLPDDLKPYIKVTAPQIGPYEVVVGDATIGCVDGVYQDVFDVRPMTEDEKATAITVAMNMRHLDSWVFDYDKCKWVPVLDQPGSEPNVIG